MSCSVRIGVLVLCWCLRAFAGSERFQVCEFVLVGLGVLGSRFSFKGLRGLAVRDVESRV